MSDKLLWKRLTENDFNTMHAQAQKSGTGGGAMHIALGVDNSNRFPIKDFLYAGASSIKEISTDAYPPHFEASVLTLD